MLPHLCPLTGLSFMPYNKTSDYINSDNNSSKKLFNFWVWQIPTGKSVSYLSKSALQYINN